MRSLDIAGTGMQAQQTNVEVISNNMANMTTTGFKRRRAEFQDLIYQNLRRVGSNSSDSGTVVPSGAQVGLGVVDIAVDDPERVPVEGPIRLPRHADHDVDLVVRERHDAGDERQRRTRVLADDAQLCMKEPALGLVPDLTGTKPLVDIVGADLAVELALMWHGGMRILDKIEGTGAKLFAERPTLDNRDKAVVLGKALAWRGETLPPRTLHLFNRFLSRASH